MYITNEYTKDQKIQLGNFIKTTSRYNKNLTPRTEIEVDRWLNRKLVFWVNHNNEPVGWVVCEPINYITYELKSLYVLPEFTRKGLATSLIQESSKVQSYNYIASTYNLSVTYLFHTNGFELINLTKLPKKTLLDFVMTRKMSSIIKSIRRKSYICYKKKHD